MNDHPDLYIVKQVIRSYRELEDAQARMTKELGCVELGVVLLDHRRLQFYREGSHYYTFEVKVGRTSHYELHLRDEVSLLVIEPTEYLHAIGFMQNPETWKCVP